MGLRNGEAVTVSDESANLTVKAALKPLAQASQSDTELAVATDYAPPKAQTSEIVKAGRRIITLQNGLAQGIIGGSPTLDGAMQELSELLRRRNATEFWSSEVEVAAIYVLSGGDPSVLGQLSTAKGVSEDHRKLLLGVESYASADRKRAVERLLSLNALQFASILPAQLSMAQAQLRPIDDINGSLQALAFAADAAPGTLVEEAAIRRLVHRLDSADNQKKLFYWAGRYLRRFPQSVYYNEFENGFIASFKTLIEKTVELDSKALRDFFLQAQEKKAAKFSRQMLLTAIAAGNSMICEKVFAALHNLYDQQSVEFRDIAVLVRICSATNGDEKNLIAMKLIDQNQLDSTVASRLRDAIKIAEGIQNPRPFEKNTSFGPVPPLSIDADYREFVASVTQQLDASVVASNRADRDANSSETRQ
jgi:hypothetical protein